MNLQVKRIDLSNATFLNGALLDSGKIKSEPKYISSTQRTDNFFDGVNCIYNTIKINNVVYYIRSANYRVWVYKKIDKFPSSPFLLYVISSTIDSLYCIDYKNKYLHVLLQNGNIGVYDIETGNEIDTFQLMNKVDINGFDVSNISFNSEASVDGEYFYMNRWVDTSGNTHYGLLVLQNNFSINNTYYYKIIYFKETNIGYSRSYRGFVLQCGVENNYRYFLPTMKIIDWQNDIIDSWIVDWFNSSVYGNNFLNTEIQFGYDKKNKRYLFTKIIFGGIWEIDDINKTIKNTSIEEGYLTGWALYGNFQYYTAMQITFCENYVFYATTRNKFPYVYIHNYREDQTALWQNQNLGSAGVINQIAVKDNNLGTRKWFIKKSTNTTWTEFEPNKYYSTPLLKLSATETFDLKVEMGNFYDPIKEQIEIEEISILFTPEINLPIVKNLQITNETLTVSLTWDSNSVMNYHVQEAKATIAEWQTIATTTGTTFTITYTDPEQQQIPHYFRILGILNNGYTEPTNVVVAYPSQGGEENIYKYCNNQLLSILKNDSRLADIQEWLDYPPDKTTVKHKIIGWVTYRGERINNWVALGERELWLSFEIGVLVKESERRNRFNSLTKPERKDYSFLIKEILYELNNRTLNDYIYDMEMYEELPYRRKDYHSISIINVILKKRIRR